MQASETTALGPVDYLVVEFDDENANFTGEMADELAKLVASGQIRILDLLLVHKDENGDIEGTEVHEEAAGTLGELLSAETDIALLLAEEDIAKVGGELQPGSSAAVLVWENTWAGPFADAIRRAGGQLVANGRIPTQALLAAADAEAEREEA